MSVRRQAIGLYVKTLVCQEYCPTEMSEECSLVSDEGQHTMMRMTRAKFVSFIIRGKNHFAAVRFSQREPPILSDPLAILSAVGPTQIDMRTSTHTHMECA